eukprot:9545089-Lingulodinium_polyedra.AAC.1
MGHTARRALLKTKVPPDRPPVLCAAGDATSLKPKCRMRFAMTFNCLSDLRCSATANKSMPA